MYTKSHTTLTALDMCLSAFFLFLHLRQHALKVLKGLKGSQNLQNSSVTYNSHDFIKKQIIITKLGLFEIQKMLHLN